MSQCALGERRGRTRIRMRACSGAGAAAALWLAAACGAASSGFYADNGAGQTVVQHVLSVHERNQLQLHILDLLGLPARPRVVRPNLATSASRFLLAVYSHRSPSPVPAGASPVFRLAPADLRAVDASDVVLSFASRGAIHYNVGMRLWFDVSELPSGENVIASELRLYQIASVFVSEAGFTVSLHLLTTVNGRELQLVDSVNTSSDHEGWLVLNVTRPFTTWVAFPETNLGLQLSVQLTAHPGYHLSPDDAGIVFGNQKQGHEPFLLAFLRSSLPRQPLHLVQVHEDTLWTRLGRWKTASGTQSSRTYRQTLFRSEQPHWNQNSSPCKISNLHVNFSELHWSDWIIAPKGYNAFLCSGDCSGPMNAHLYPTNHAIVQMLVHMNSTSKVPKPCCAPIKLAPLSILHYSNEGAITIRNYHDMIVTACGCL